MEQRTTRSSHFVTLQDHPERGLLGLALPMIVAFTFQTGFNIVDTIFVGRLGPSSLAGVSLAFPFQVFVIALASGFGIGAQSLIARSIGGRHLRDADNAAEHALILAVIGAVVTTIVGLLALPSLLGFLDAPPSVYDEAYAYLFVILLGSVFMYLTVIANAVLRGEGDTKHPMIIMGAAAVLNVIFDPIFIFVLDWGVAGAAFATVLSRALVFIFIFYLLFVKKSTFLRFDMKHFSFSTSILRGIVDVGFPASLGTLSFSLSLFFLNSILAPFGRDALAAFGVGFRVESLVFLPMIGLSSAFVSAVGFFKGAQLYDNIRRINIYAMKMLVGLMLVCLVVFYVFPGQIMNIFTNEEGVISIGVGYLRVLAPFYPILPLSFLSAAGFQGIGRGYPSFVLAFIRSGVVSVPMALLLIYVFDFSVQGVWLSIATGDFLSAIVGYVWFRRALSRLSEPFAHNDVAGKAAFD